MDGCYYLTGKFTPCDECEHWDGSSCMNGEKLMSEAESKIER